MSPEQANAAFRRLTPNEQAAVTEANAVVEIRVVVEETASNAGVPADAVASGGDAENMASTMAASACYGAYTRTAVGYNRLGVETFKYSQQVSMCTNSGGWVSSAWCSAWSHGLAWGYSFNGHITYCAVTYGGIGWNLIKYFSQGGFKFCAVWCEDYTPWVAQQLQNDGAYFSRIGG